MAVKYVKDFAYDPGFGFTGSSGGTTVKSHMRAPVQKAHGGVMKKGMGGKIAPAMVEKRSQGLGGLASETKKLAAYDKPHMEGKKGAKVAQYAKGGAVKHPKKSMAKMIKKADGGDVASPEPMRIDDYKPSGPPPPQGMMVNPNYGKPGQDYYIDINPPSLPSLPPGYEPPPLAGDDGGRNDFLRELVRRDEERIKGDAAEQMRRLAAIRERESIMPTGESTYVGPAPRAMDMIQVDDMIMTREDAERMKRLPAPIEPGANISPVRAGTGSLKGLSGGLGQMVPGASTPRLPMAGEPGFGTSKGLSPSPLAAAARRMAPQDRREMRADRREMARNIMDQYIAGPRRAMPAPRRAMPVAPRRPMIDRAMIAPAAPPAMYAKGGKVSKGEAKVGKVMGEFKRGELHSGSKKGPVVTNPKQAKAIALSEARAAGAKIPKKAMGGKACG